MQQQTSIAPIESSIEFSVIPFPQNRFCGAVARWLNIIWCLHMTYFSEHLFTAQFVNCWFACSLFIHQIPQTFTQYSMDYTIVSVSVSVWNMCHTHTMHSTLLPFFIAGCSSFLFCVCVSVSSTPQERFVLFATYTKQSHFPFVNDMHSVNFGRRKFVFALKREFIGWTTKTTIVQYTIVTSWLTESAFPFDFRFSIPWTFRHSFLLLLLCSCFLDFYRFFWGAINEPYTFIICFMSVE